MSILKNVCILFLVNRQSYNKHKKLLSQFYFNQLITKITRALDSLADELNMAHWNLGSDSCKFELWKRVLQKRSPTGFRGSARNWSAVGKVGERTRARRVASLDRIALEPMNAPRQMLRIIFESWPGFWVYIRMRGGAFSRGPGVLTPILLFSTRTRVNLNACVARKGAFSHARNGSAAACNRIFRPNDRARNA